MDRNNQEILSEREVSNWLGISEPTLFRHRRDGTGPKVHSTEPKTRWLSSQRDRKLVTQPRTSKP